MSTLPAPFLTHDSRPDTFCPDRNCRAITHHYRKLNFGYLAACDNPYFADVPCIAVNITACSSSFSHAPGRTSASSTKRHDTKRSASPKLK